MPVDLTITRLSVTPVKGLLLQHPDSIDLTPHGAVGDRLFYLVDDAGGVQSCTANAGLFGLRADFDPDTRLLEVARGSEVLVSGVIDPGASVVTDLWGTRNVSGAVVTDPVWSTFFSDVVGRRVQLLEARDSAYDVEPVTLLGSRSVDELAHRSGLSGLDARRFRMLIEFSGGEPRVEDSWAGSRVDVGDAVLRGGGPVKRCAATTRDPDDGTVDLQTLKLIMSDRGRQDFGFGPGAHFGVYAEVVEPGKVSVGDRLTVTSGS